VVENGLEFGKSGLNNIAIASRRGEEVVEFGGADIPKFPNGSPT